MLFLNSLEIPGFSAASQSACRTASWKAGLTWRISWLWRSGQVRLVSSATATPASRSIHSEQPLKPRWPMECGEKCRPELEGCEGVSQPSARELPAGPCRWAKSSTVAALKRRPCPEWADRISRAKRSRSGTLEKSSGMAGRAAQQPCVFILHFALNHAMAEGRVLLGGRNEAARLGGRIVEAPHRAWVPHPRDIFVSVARMGFNKPRRGQAKRLKNPAATQTGRASPVSASSALPSRMKPGSEYSARAPGSASSGSSRQACSSASAVAAVRKNSHVTRQAGVVRQAGGAASPAEQDHPRRASPAKPGSNSPSGVSRRSSPRWCSSIAAAVVAATLVRLATS